MIPSVEAVLQQAARLLGDPTQRKFSDSVLQPYFEMAYEEMTGEMARYHLSKQKRAVLYTLPASTTSLDPDTAGISNFGELIRMEERASGSSDLYTLVESVDRLPQVEAREKLYYREWYDDTWHFLGATQAVDLLITYYDSGEAPTSGSIGVDGSKNFLAYRTAAAAGYAHGNDNLGVLYDKQARGPNLDGGGGFLHTLLQAMVTAEQQTRMQAPAYRAAGYLAGGQPRGVPRI